MYETNLTDEQLEKAFQEEMEMLDASYLDMRYQPRPVREDPWRNADDYSMLSDDELAEEDRGAYEERTGIEDDLYASDDWD